MLNPTFAILLLLAVSLMSGRANAADLVADRRAGMSFWRVTAIGDTPTDAEDAVVMVDPYHFRIILSTPCGDTGYSLYLENGVFREFTNFMYSIKCMASPRERAFADAIAKVKTYRQDAETLSLNDGNGIPKIVLTRFYSKGLEYRQWFIEQHFDGQNLVLTRNRVHELPPDWPSLPQVVFMSGRLDGSSGGGALWGDYSPIGAKSEIRIRASSFATGFWYPEDIKLGEQILEALSGERTIERDGDDLLLRDAQGTVQVILAPPHW